MNAPLSPPPRPPQLYLGLRALIESTAAQFGAATIVSTSSASHYDSYAYGVATSIADLNDEANYSPLLAYGQSKLAQVVFTQELARRMAAEGKNVFVNVYHPGVVATNILEPLLDSLRNVAFLPTAVIEVRVRLKTNVSFTAVAIHGSISFVSATLNNRIESISDIFYSLRVFQEASIACKKVSQAPLYFFLLA